MLKYFIICVLMMIAPSLTFAKAPTKCAKGDKACEKKKAKDKKAKTAKKTDKKPSKKVAKKADKKPAKVATKKSDKKKKKVAEEKMIAPFNDTGEPAPDTLTPPSSSDAGTTAAAPAVTAKDLEGDIFPESSNSGSSAPSADSSSATPDGIGSDSDFDIGDELPSE